MFVYVCFVLYLCMGWFCWLTWKMLCIWEEFWSVYLLVTVCLSRGGCQPLLGVDHSPEFEDLYYLYADRGLLFFRWQQRHFEFQPARVAVEGRSNVMLNMHARLQISLPMRFLSLLHSASQCAFGSGVCWLLVRQFFILFAQQQNLMKIMFSCISFPIWPYPPPPPPPIMKKLYCILYW